MTAPACCRALVDFTQQKSAIYLSAYNLITYTSSHPATHSRLKASEISITIVPLTCFPGLEIRDEIANRIRNPSLVPASSRESAIVL